MEEFIPLKLTDNDKKWIAMIEWLDKEIMKFRFWQPQPQNNQPNN